MLIITLEDIIGLTVVAILLVCAGGYIALGEISRLIKKIKKEYPNAKVMD
jgi:hypothetical protein